MNEKLEESIRNIITPGLNNPEAHVSTHYRFDSYLLLNFSDLNEAQIYKMFYRNSPHQKIEIVMSFDYLNVLKTNDHTEDYHIRETNDEFFLMQFRDKKYIYVGEKLNTFKTIDIIVKYNSEYGFNDVKYPYAYGEENIYFMLHQKFIPIQEYEKSTEKSEYDRLYKMDGDMKGDNITDGSEGIVENGNDFFYCKNNHAKQ